MLEFFNQFNFTEEDLSLFETATIEKKQVSPANQMVYLTIKVAKTLPFRVFDRLVKVTSSKTHYQVDLEVLAEETSFTNSELHRYKDYVIQQSISLSVLEDVWMRVKDRQCIFLYENEKEKEKLEPVIQKLEDALHHIGITIAAVLQQKEEPEPYTVEAVRISSSPVKKEAAPLRKQNYKRSRKNLESLPPVPLHELVEELANICVEGVVFEMDHRTLSTGSVLETLSIYDKNDAISLKRFVEADQDDEDVIRIGESIRFYGDYLNDLFAKENIFKIKSFQRIDPLFSYKDTAKEKRVELHAHTTFSEMDAVIDVGKLVKRAVEWKHRGVAITDHSVVQSFPKAYHALMKEKQKNPDLDFKIAYGIEMNMVNLDLAIVKNPHQQSIQDATYVVFDLETTGLSARFDHIIEFGAVKIQQNSIVDQIQLFIKPPVSVRPFIQDLTNISDETLAGEKSLEDVLPRLLEFIGDGIMVAHNASFDLRFMQAACQKCGLPSLDNTVIDTLDLSRALFRQRSSYRLGSIARTYKITYAEEVAHRADYDAEVLANVLQAMFKDERIAKMDRVDDLQLLSDEEAFKKVNKYHVNLLARDSIGLKHLYELVSLSHTDYLMVREKSQSSKSESIVSEPRIPKEEIIKVREHLLIGSSCLNGEVFETAANQTQDELERIMAFYDYIEIQPLNNYYPLLNSGSVENFERIKAIIQVIIETARKLNKPIVATGDAHYLDPHEKVFRDVYINAQGIGGVRHPLYIFNQQRRMQATIPDQHFRSTAEMLNDFAYLGESDAYEFVVENPNKLLDGIADLSPIKDRLYTPSIEGSDEKLKEICYQTAHELYGNPLPEIVETRLDRELSSIIKHGFGVIYYIAHLLVKKSLEDGYIVGSRGSVGSSLVATMANITEVNPLAPHYVCLHCHHSEFIGDSSIASGYDLVEKQCPECGEIMKGDGQNIPFETFLGFEADKVPDIDLNFSGEYQEFAHAYTKVLFGEKYVYRAGTIGTVAQKTAFGYVMGYYENKGMPPAIHQAYRNYLALGCEGVKRTTGQHPGGIIVIPSDMDVHDFTPVQYPANNKASEWKTTHFEFADIHDNVLKLDILGHVDPTATKLLERLSGLSVKDINVSDPKTMSLFSSIEALNIDKRKYNEQTGAVGLPEFGTRFVRRMLEDTRPKSFSELVQISGLSHGTDVWANNAQNLIVNEHKALHDVIGCRDDIMTYLVNHKLPSKSAFDIMESVRKGKGLKEDWIALMIEHGVPQWYIDSCLKIKYMFPKAHAVAYVTSAVRIAWFKVYRPREYYAVFFTLRVEAWEIETLIKGADEIAKRLSGLMMRLQDNNLKRDVSNKEVNLIDTLEVALEMTLRGYKFSPISLEKSNATEFSLDSDRPMAILPPFKVVEGLGDNVARSIVEQREKQAFISKKDLLSRTALSTTLLKKLEDLNVLDHLDDDNQLSLF